MPGDPRLQELLEEILDSDRTPEDVCQACPELLPQVRERLRRLEAVDAQFDAFFLSAESSTEVPDPAEIVPPQLPGHEVLAVLGRGGMGVVYKARDLRLHRFVALKMLLAGAHARPEEVERFLRGAEAKAALRHPNIVQVHEFGNLDGRPYFTMEFVEGGNLAQKISGTPLPALPTAALVATLAEAVQAAHDGGIIHRDLKPANILLTADGTPKVADFGLARRMDEWATLTLSGAILGTPSYMAPEQAEGKKEIGPTADVYALGAILYEMLTGRPPFRGETATATLQQVVSEDPVPPSRLNRQVPRDLETICLKCLQKEPKQRYARAALLAEDLHRFGRGEAIMARPVGSTERLLRWVRRRPALGAASAASLLLALALVGVGLRWHGQWSSAVQDAVVDAEADLREAELAQKDSDFIDAAAALGRAKLRLGAVGPAELHRRLEEASRSLELVRRLDAIRLDRVQMMTLNTRPVVGKGPGDWTPPGRKYEETFREAGLGTVHDDPRAAAARVASSPVREALVAALDDCATCTADPEQRKWALEVARLADPDPWRDRLRDIKTWGDRAALTNLAASAQVDKQSPQILVMLGGLLRSCGADPRGNS
jgi:tRNA A-37 threonylcarbamoyl transferase component Bud32